MIIPEDNREAWAAIRGYIYQFDASILAILEADPDAIITIEGIEDVDATLSKSIMHQQFKYISSKKLTDPALRDAIAPMIKGFLACKEPDRMQKKYVLYGYFKECPADIPALTLEDLRRILIHRPYFRDEKGNKSRLDSNIQEQLGASDADLLNFCGRFSFKSGEDFETHRLKVIDHLAKELQVYQDESKGYCYPSALTKITDLGIRPEKSLEHRAFNWTHIQRL
jgi:hypothetical protein